jgi:hypothetical protein
VDCTVPIPSRLVTPWIEDNKKFIEHDLRRRNEALARLRSQRGQFIANGRILQADSTYKPIPLYAVDAAKIEQPIGDLITILIQTVCVGDNDDCVICNPVRHNGIHGHETSLAGNALRVAAECQLLKESKNFTIADLSFMTLLMEVNLCWSQAEHGSNDLSKLAADQLINQSWFLDTVRNHNVIGMSKFGEAKTIDKVVSDREVFDKILDAGEYSKPYSIVEGLRLQQTQRGSTTSLAAVGFADRERQEIKTIYEKLLQVTYYKPHSWSRAFRIEAYSEVFADRDRLMPLLSAIHEHTKVRDIVEPFPQFMADFTASTLTSAVAILYGEINRCRTEFITPRTRRRHS